MTRSPKAKSPPAISPPRPTLWAALILALLLSGGWLGLWGLGRLLL